MLMANMSRTPVVRLVTRLYAAHIMQQNGFCSDALRSACNATEQTLQEERIFSRPVSLEGGYPDGGTGGEGRVSRNDRPPGCRCQLQVEHSSKSSGGALQDRHLSRHHGHYRGHPSQSGSAATSAV
ncbi:unnamed protein product [Sphagnum balticum]